jgi:hypothetical protein
MRWKIALEVVPVPDFLFLFAGAFFGPSSVGQIPA